MDVQYCLVQVLFINCQKTDAIYVGGSIEIFVFNCHWTCDYILIMLDKINNQIPTCS